MNKNLKKSLLLTVFSLGTTFNIVSGAGEPTSNRDHTGSSETTTSEEYANYTYTHYEQDCIQESGSNVVSDKLIGVSQNYAIKKFYSNGEKGLPENCVGTRKKAEYTITLALDGGTLTGGVIYNTDGSFTLSTPIKNGYVFLGWTGSNGDEPETEITVPATTAKNLTYVANWKLNVLYGYQNAASYNSSFSDTAPEYYKTGTAYYWKNYSYKTSSYSCNCGWWCYGSRVEGNSNCPGDSCDWRENSGGCWWHANNGGYHCGTCWNNATASCGWTDKTSISAAGCTTGQGLNNNGTQSTKTVYYEVKSWSDVIKCGETQCSTKTTTRRLVKSTDGGETWNAY